ncbi:MAG: hypothetical protein IJ153_04520 [Clostridia bacterium]|nr:hypothetical protein [Clostridia bacterium]
MSFQVDLSALARGWGKYFLMHGDRRVATLREDGRCTIYYPSFLPYHLYLESGDDLDARVNNLNNFIYWCATRVLTLDRKYVKEILNSIHAPQSFSDRDRARIALSYHCLSLTDIFWVKRPGEKISFAQINLFEHSLSGAFVDVSLVGKALTAQNSELLTQGEVAGDLATQGVAPKAWVRQQETFFLLKDGDARDVAAELTASRVLDCFQAEHVRYTPDEFDGKRVSRSRLLTSLDWAIVPMEQVEIYCANHGLRRESFVLRKGAYQFYMMNILDYLVGNTDRHWGNWGFWVENRTHRMTRLYPLMDFNKAFQAYDTLEGGRCQTLEGNLSQREAAERAVRAVGLNRIQPIPPEIFPEESWREMFFQRLGVLERAEP